VRIAVGGNERDTENAVGADSPDERELPRGPI